MRNYEEEAGELRRDIERLDLDKTEKEQQFKRIIKEKRENAKNKRSPVV